MMSLTHVMLVEDETDIQEIAKLSLEEIGGFQLTVCSSGLEALQQVAENPPQVILLDAMMPGMDGPTTLKQLKKIPQGQNIPVIFMIARVQSNEVEEYMKQGAIGVIPKPFDPSTLPGEVVRIWSQAADRLNED